MSEAVYLTRLYWRRAWQLIRADPVGDAAKMAWRHDVLALQEAAPGFYERARHLHTFGHDREVTPDSHANGQIDRIVNTLGARRRGITVRCSWHRNVAGALRSRRLAGERPIPTPIPLEV